MRSLCCWLFSWPAVHPSSSYLCCCCWCCCIVSGTGGHLHNIGVVLREASPSQLPPPPPVPTAAACTAMAGDKQSGLFWALLRLSQERGLQDCGLLGYCDQDAAMQQQYHCSQTSSPTQLVGKPVNYMWCALTPAIKASSYLMREALCIYYVSVSCASMYSSSVPAQDTQLPHAGSGLSEHHSYLSAQHPQGGAVCSVLFIRSFYLPSTVVTYASNLPYLLCVYCYYVTAAADRIRERASIRPSAWPTRCCARACWARREAWSCCASAPPPFSCRLRLQTQQRIWCCSPEPVRC